jgi:hypothetical protein
MLGFKSVDSACVILSGIEMIHMMRKQQGDMPAIRSHRCPSSSSCLPLERFIARLALSPPLSIFATQPFLLPCFPPGLLQISYRRGLHRAAERVNDTSDGQNATRDHVPKARREV